MLKYVSFSVAAFIAIAAISVIAPSFEGANAFENETIGSCNRTVTNNPGADPVEIPDPFNLGATIHETTNHQAETRMRIFPVNIGPPTITEPFIEGITTFPGSTLRKGASITDPTQAQFEGSGTGSYYFPTQYTLTGAFTLFPGTQVPSAFEGDLSLDGISPATQPDLDMHIICTFPQPTPTPSPVVTPSPTPGPFSIVVLKLNDATNGPIPDWEMELFANDDCSGDPIDSGLTNDDGIIDFVGLNEGVYSVMEESDPFFTPDDGNLCREDIEVPGASQTVGDNGFIECPISNGEFPDPGCDSFASGGQVNIELASGGEPFTVTLNGPTTIVRETGPQDQTEFPASGSAQPSGNGNGLDEVITEMIQLDLVGETAMFGDVQVRESPTLDSDGMFEELQGGNGAAPQGPVVADGVIDFPAASYFDIFIEIDIVGVGTVYNQDPLRMECVINEIPPLLCLYQPPIDEPIPLYFLDDDDLFAYIVHAAHVPIPQGEVFVVFRNVPVEDKLLIHGDWDCDEDADAVDALKVLQFVAAVVFSQNQPCPEFEEEVTIALIVLLWGDVDCDGDIDAVDALKILQFLAGLPYTQEPDCPTILDP